MALYVNTNISSLNAQSNLANSTNNVTNYTKKLSSGLRINSAKDDPANLQISSKFTSQLDSLNRGTRNADEGIALLQTAEGSLGEITELLQRIRTSALRSANGINTSADRLAIQDEVNEFCQEITRIACKTTFGGSQLLRGKGVGLVDKNGNIELQVGANSHNNISLSLQNSFTMDDLVNNIQGVGIGYDQNTKSFDVTTEQNAQDVLANIDKYIEYVDSKRNQAGSSLNRLESTIKNQNSTYQNEADARSRIRDTDFALETSNLMASRINEQASSQILMQANTVKPNFVLKLLG